MWREANWNSGLPYTHLQMCRDEEIGENTRVLARLAKRDEERHRTCAWMFYQNRGPRLAGMWLSYAFYFCYVFNTFLIWEPSRLWDALTLMVFLYNMYDHYTNQNHQNDPMNASRFCLFCQLCRKVYIIPIVGVHMQSGEHISRTVILSDHAPEEIG
jgi:hypothetical protein